MGGACGRLRPVLRLLFKVAGKGIVSGGSLREAGVSWSWDREGAAGIGGADCSRRAMLRNTLGSTCLEPEGDRAVLGAGSDVPGSVAASSIDRRSARSTGGESTVKLKSDKPTEPIRRFANRAAWAVWLEKNHRNRPGLWLRFAKKGSGVRSVTYAEALEMALCYGWIDGQKRGESNEAWLQRFLPRSAKSIWSKINREKANALIASGQMKAAGREVVERARKDGRWKAAYDSPKGAKVPKDFQVALDKNPRAREFFLSIDGANRYALLFRIQTVKKAETRARKIAEFVEMLERNETIHEPRKPRRQSR